MDYVAVLDFEATCDRDRAFATQEVIELPVVLLRLCDDPDATGTGKARRTVKHVAELHTYVKPVVEPQLTPFCRELTGITQAQVDGGLSFVDALVRLDAFLREHVGSGEHVSGGDVLAQRVLFVICGDWDLKTMLPRQFAASGIAAAAVPPYLRRWCNVKRAYRDTYRREGRGMAEMLGALGLPLVGRHHSGIDDARNIAAIVRRIVADGGVLRATSG